jgi:Protein of unknown function (DUF1573)
MKKFIFTLSSVLFLSTAVFAQTPSNSVAPAALHITDAEMTFEKEVHDFGNVEFAGNGTYEFKFKNTGTEPLIITDAKGSCGCTIPTYPKNIPIKPGETQIIKVTYDTKRVGNFTKTVTINSNSKRHVDVLTIRGNVQAEVTEEVFPIGKKSDNGATPFEKH